MRNKTIWSRSSGRSATDECQHTEIVTTDTAGLSRSACANCGHVSVSFLYAMWQEQAEENAEVDAADQA